VRRFFAAFQLQERPMTHWPHAPLHLLQIQGIYMVTAGTYLKSPFFNTEPKLNLLLDHLLNLSRSLCWELHAWAIFPNHYHFVSQSPSDPSSLKKLISQLHRLTAIELNKLDQTPQRKVWYQYWDSKITIQTSYLARLNYVHQNPVKHGLVSKASHYPWCSASEFEMKADHSFVKSVYNFDYTKVKVFDEY
jgi:putative transposase